VHIERPLSRYDYAMFSLRRERVWGATAFLSVVLFVVPAIASAADLNLSPTSGSKAVGAEFDVKVLLDPGGEKVNASDGEITFDAALLSVSKISKDGSAFSLWTADPTFSNSAGTVDYSGGTPTAFSNSGTVITITFKGKAKGSAKVSVSKGSVLAADGKGTNVYKNGGTASFDITDAPPPAPDTTDAAPTDSGGDGAVGPVPLAPTISSPTHPKEDSWYSTSTAIFIWNVLAEDTDVRTLVSQNDSDAPKVNMKKIATSTTVTKVPDGISYFFVQLKNDSGWGAVGKRKIQIDTVPPKDFDVALVDPGGGATPKLSFKTDDELSGMDRYEVVINNAIAVTIQASAVTDGTAPVPVQKGGDTAVTIRAFDKAGNKTEATKTLKLPKVDPPLPEGTPAPTGFWTWERIILILLFMILAALITWIMRTRNQGATAKSILLHRVAEMGDRNDRVFAAMREQFEDMVKNLDARPQLTPEEREFWEETKEVLDISEDQINSGIADLKRMIREG
jgi:hypothetical protein